MPLETKVNNKEFVVALYSRPNESFPSKLDVSVNGNAGVFVEGQPCILPRFLVNQALMSRQFTHREIEGSDTYETIEVKPNISTTVIPEEYQSPEGIRKLLADASKIKDRSSPYYRVRLGCKNLVFGDMTSAEKRAGYEISSSPKAINHDIDRTVSELQSKLKEKDDALASVQNQMDEMKKMMTSFMAQKSDPIVDDESERTFEGKVYKTVSAKKSAETKAKAKQEAQSLEPIEISE